MPFICDFFGLDNHERTSDVMKVLNKHTGSRGKVRALGGSQVSGLN